MGGEGKGSVGRRSAILALLGVSLLAVLLHLPSLRGEFLQWDDEWLVVTNPFLDEVEDLGWILDPTAHRRLLGAEYLPVRDLSDCRTTIPG